MPETKRPLKVFLCHAHPDREAVHDLYVHLITDNVDAWLDKEKLIGGQDWEFEIRKAVRESDVVIVCLSKQFAQRGFRQYEVRIALEEANFQPEGEIFIIPLRLEDCNVPQSLRRWHWVDLFEVDGYDRLMRALRARADRIGATLQVRRSWLPKITSSRSTERTPVKTEKSVISKKNVEEQSEIPPNNGLPHIDEPLPPPEKFPESWNQEWQPSFEPDTTTEESKSSAQIDLASPKSAQETEAQTAGIVALREAFSKAKPFIGRAVLLSLISLLIWLIFAEIPVLPPSVPTTTPSSTTSIPTNRPTATQANTPIPTRTRPPANTRTPASTSLPATITDTKGVRMVLVPESEFIMGSDEDAYYIDVDQQPAHNVFLDAFYIDKYEATNVLYKMCVDAGVCTRPYNRSSNNRGPYYGNFEFDNYPVIYVDWYQAKTYCAWRGARLPTEAEWEKAAQGSEGTANRAGGSDGGGDTAEVGSYPDHSFYGAYDMMGNVWEWVNDWYQSDYYTTLGDNAANPPGPSEGDRKVLRGGSFSPGVLQSPQGGLKEWGGSIINRYSDYPSRYYNDIGFRCSRDVDS